MLAGHETVSSVLPVICNGDITSLEGRKTEDLVLKSKYLVGELKIRWQKHALPVTLWVERYLAKINLCDSV
jgi:hypothetical protein